MRRHRLRVAAGLLLGLTGAAHADVRFCNNFPRTIFIAVAYKQDNGSWYARGWLSVTTGECAEFNNPPLKVRAVLYRAETDDYKQGSKTVRDTWGDESHEAFGISDPGFAWDNAKSLSGKASGARLVGFYDPNVTSVGSDLSMTVTYEADGSNHLDMKMGSP